MNIIIFKYSFGSVYDYPQSRTASRNASRNSFLPLEGYFFHAGHGVTGEYTVKDPGGSLRVVTYHADKEGFHAVVHTTGKNDHSGGVYGGQGHETQDHLHEYPALSAHAAAFWKKTIATTMTTGDWSLLYVPGTIRLFLSRIVNVDVSVLYTKGNNGPSDITRKDNVSYIFVNI